MGKFGGLWQVRSRTTSVQDLLLKDTDPDPDCNLQTDPDPDRNLKADPDPDCNLVSYPDPVYVYREQGKNLSSFDSQTFTSFLEEITEIIFEFQIFLVLLHNVQI